jgi:hypothetical protein
MTSRNMTAELMDFLASYRNAFQSYDTDAIVAHSLPACQRCGAGGDDPSRDPSNARRPSAISCPSTGRSA